MSNNRNSDGRDVNVTRHFCSSPHHKGPRWMLAVYFYRHRRNRSGLQSACMTCTKIQMRAENLSARVKRNRSVYSREYKRNRRREAGVPIRKLNNPRFDALELVAWIERFISVRELETLNNRNGGTNLTTYLNGIELRDKDARFISHLRTGGIDRAGLEKVDELSIRYDLPLWEIEEVASRYKRDIRAARRDRRLRATD